MPEVCIPKTIAQTGADAPRNHDWGNIFIDFDMLGKHRQIANFANSGRTIIMVLALTRGAYVLYKQYQNLG